MKQCHRCGVDVSTSRRFKDVKGRYLCEPCNDAVQAAVAAQQVSQMGEQAGSGHGSESFGSRVASSGPELIDVPRDEAVTAPDEGYGIVQDESVHTAGDATARTCPSCARSLAADAIVCVNCGFNTKEGVTVKAPPKKKEKKPASIPKCRHCGYDIRGLNTLTCPECGGKISLSRRDHDADDSRAVMRKAYLRPIIMTAVGIGAMSAIYVGMGQPLAIVAHLIGLAVFTTFGTVAFFVCCLLWIGFDAPMHLSALRLLGIFSLLVPLSVLYGILPGFVSIILLLATAVAMLAKELELDLPDAVFLGLAMGLIQLAGFATIIALVSKLL